MARLFPREMYGPLVAGSGVSADDVATAEANYNAQRLVKGGEFARITRAPLGGERRPYIEYWRYVQAYAQERGIPLTRADETAFQSAYDDRRNRSAPLTPALQALDQRLARRPTTTLAPPVDTVAPTPAPPVLSGPPGQQVPTRCDIKQANFEGGNQFVVVSGTHNGQPQFHVLHVPVPQGIERDPQQLQAHLEPLIRQYGTGGVPLATGGVSPPLLTQPRLVGGVHASQAQAVAAIDSQWCAPNTNTLTSAGAALFTARP
jgi:hypothetical protein